MRIKLSCFNFISNQVIVSVEWIDYNVSIHELSASAENMNTMSESDGDPSDDESCDDNASTWENDDCVESFPHQK